MTRVSYIKAGSGTSKKTGEKFYTINILVGEEAVTCFVTPDVFKKIVDKKPVYKKEYMAEFEVGARFGYLTATLVDLQDIK